MWMSARMERFPIQEDGQGLAVLMEVRRDHCIAISFKGEKLGAERVRIGGVRAYTPLFIHYFTQLNERTIKNVHGFSRKQKKDNNSINLYLRCAPWQYLPVRFLSKFSLPLEKPGGNLYNYQRCTQ